MKALLTVVRDWISLQLVEPKMFKLQKQELVAEEVRKKGCVGMIPDY